MKQSEEALRAELEATKAELADQKMLFKEILEGTLAGFWDWNIPNSTEYLSPTFKRMFGYEDHEIENTPQAWQELIFQEDLPMVFQIFDRHVSSRGKEPYDCNVRYHHKNGSTVHVWCRGKVVEWGENGEAIRMVGSHIDVTELAEAKQRLEESTLEQALIIQGINAGIWSWNINSGSEWWSDTFYELLGYSKNDVISSYESFLRLVHTDDKVKLKQGFEAHFKQKEPFKIDVRFLTKKEGYKWFESSGQATFNAKNEPTFMCGCIIDVHERKLTEERLAKNDLLLKQTGKLAKVGGWEVSLPEMQPNWSDEVYRIHEVPIGEQPPIDKALDFYPEPDKSAINKLLDRAINKGIAFDQEFNFITAKNNPKIVRSIGRPVLNEKNEVIGLHGVFQDVTDKKNQELALQDSLDILSEQNKRLLSFAHIVSHNLNSHTSNIKALLGFLKNAGSQEESQEFIAMMSEAAQHLENTIFHLNEIVKIQTDINRNKTNISFETVWNSTINSLQAVIAKSKARLSTNFEVETINYVPAYLESILLNLTTNAIKYRKPDTAPQIEVHTFVENNKTWLTVKDNGLGINLKRHGAKLFGMYNTFHKNEDSRGIGLFLIKNQVEAMGGEILVESEVNVGTTFKLRLT